MWDANASVPIRVHERSRIPQRQRRSLTDSMTRATTATTDASGILLAPVVAGDPGQRVRISSAGPDLVLSKKEVCQQRRNPMPSFVFFSPFLAKKLEEGASTLHP